MDMNVLAEAIHTTVVPITLLIRTTVVPISGVIDKSVTWIASATGTEAIGTTVVPITARLSCG